MKRKVLLFGTFDNLHPGHRDFFRQAAKLGDVIAIIARDKNVKKIKGAYPHARERSRLLSVARDKNVFKAMLGDRNDFLRPVERIQPDIIALGHDQQTFTVGALKRELKSRKLTPKIVRLKSHQPQKFKSSILKNK
ncbi:MAG: adenylyltransferase/cytidyltransferase family protein [Patescibacteria group bacterium]